jgi:hypothetical protein
MSSIDERIVQMRFNNDQFEKGIAQTSQSLTNLKDKLNFDGVKNSIANIGANFKGNGLDQLAQSVDGIAAKFTALSAAASVAFGNIAAQAIQTGITAVKSLTIQPIFQGYQDYNAKLTSVQTIAAATGKSIKEIEPYFNALDTYADKTIYNLSDMTSALAKFTNAGVDLDKAIPAIKGISNMTALAGQSAGAAGIAYYNLSQSIAGGFLTTIDYKSLNLANIATKEWKTQMINAAVAAGTLKKGANGIYNIPGSKKAYTDARLFTEGLSEQWATTDILLKVLGDYGDTTTAIGAKAQASAQDVKSLSMMMETLKAAVGTGWTDTFQIVIGDLDESKKLWTGLTQSIQGYLDAATEARNKLLQGWKDFGGRTALIDTLAKMFTNIANIFKAVGEAFSDIFPPTTSKQLYDLTIGFQNLVDNLTPSVETLNNLKRTLRGVFAIFGIVWEVVKAVGKAFFDLFGFTSEGSAGILKFTGSLGDFLYAIYQAIKAGDNLGKFFTGISAVIKIPIAIIKSFIITLGALLEALGSIGTDSIGTIADQLKERFKPLGDIGTTLSNVWLGVVKAFEKVGSFMKPVLKAVSDGFKAIGEAFLNSFTNANYDSVLNTINTGLFGGLIILFKRFFDGGFVSLFDGGFIQSVKGIFTQLSSTLQTFQNSLKAKTLLTIALALAVLTASVIGLSLVDPAKLTAALAAMSVMMTQLFLSMNTFAKIAGGKGIAKLPIIATALVILSVAIGVLTTSVIRLSKLSWEEIMKGLTGVATLLAMLVGVSQTMAAKAKGMIGAGIAMIAIAAAVKILASAVADFAKLSWESIAKGLVGVGVVLTQITLFSKFASASKGAIKNGIGLVLLAAAIKILASAVADFGNMDAGKLTQGLQALGGVLLILAIFNKISGSGINMIAVGAGLVILGAAMKIFASAISDLGNIPWDNLVRGLTGMAIALGIIIIAMRLMPTNMILTATGLVIVAAALTIMAGALATMGGMTWDEIGRGLTVLAGSLTILAIALMFMNGSIAGAAALIIAAGALAILAPVLKAFGKMSWEEIGKGLVMLAASLAIIAGAGYLLIGALPGLLGLGVAVLLVGAGTLLAGAGVMLLATALIALGGAAVIGTATLVTMVTAVINLIPLLMMKIGEGIINILGVIANSTVAFINAFKAILTALLVTIIQMTPLIIQTVLSLLFQILDAIVVATPKIVRAALDIIIGFLDGITAKLPEVIRAGTDLVIAFIRGIGKNAVRLANAAAETILDFINGLTKAIETYAPKIREAAGKLGFAIVDGVTGGLASKAKGAIDAVTGWGADMIDGFKKQLGINSPSKVFSGFGQNMTQGLVNGIDSTAGSVVKSTENLGQSAVDGLNKTISKISDVAIANMDMAPTIRPVLDLSAVEKDSLAINSMLTPAAISVGSAYNQAASISAEQQAAKTEAETTQQQTTTTGDTNVTFVQNNTSPKALTPAEIYRQTKNQISAAKGTLSMA